MIPSRYKITTLASALVILILDSLTKHAVINSFIPGGSKAVIAGFFDLTYVRNTGAVWGCLHDRNEWLVIVSLIVLALICIFYRCLADDRKIYRAQGAICALSIGCIAGGILGNLVDRIKFGWVVDFLDFYAYGWHWPAFNIADAAICAGAGLYLLASLLPFKRHDTTEKTDHTDTD